MTILNSFSFQNSLNNISIVIFFNDNCAVCEYMTPIYLKLKNEFKHFNFFKLNFKDSIEIFEEFNIKNFPTICIFKNTLLLKKLSYTSDYNILFNELKKL